MIKGVFTGVFLSEYLSDSRDDWANTRKVINGIDKAAECGNRAKAIYEARSGV